MILTPRQGLRIGQKVALHPQHLARREPLPAGIILPQLDELGRGRHLQIRPVELLRAIGPRVQKPREIVMRKGRLAVGHRLQSNAGLGNDLHPIRPSDPLLFFDPIGEE